MVEVGALPGKALTTLVPVILCITFITTGSYLPEKGVAMETIDSFINDYAVDTAVQFTNSLAIFVATNGVAWIAGHGCPFLDQ